MLMYGALITAFPRKGSDSSGHKCLGIGFAHENYVENWRELEGGALSYAAFAVIYFVATSCKFRMKT